MAASKVTVLYGKVLSQIPAEGPADGMPEQYPLCYYELAVSNKDDLPEDTWDGLYISRGSLGWDIAAAKVYAYDPDQAAGSKWVPQVTFSS